MVWRGISIVLGLGMASPALAHPHVFVDTEPEVIFDDQDTVTGLRINRTTVCDYLCGWTGRLLLRSL